MSVLRLADDQLERLADLIAAKLGSSPPAHSAAVVRGGEHTNARLVDAAALARLLGVSRTFVYQHADELGAIRLGEGSKRRLRFDVAAAMRCPVGKGSQAPDASGDGRSEPRRPLRARRLPDGVPKPGSILAVRGSSTP